MSARAPLSVIIIACNEADRLPRALESLAGLDEILVVDSGSTDGTPTVARAAGARVVDHPWEGYSAQKTFALGQVRHDWVLWIDADEALTPELRASIEAALAAQGERRAEHAAYAMNRRTAYLGSDLRHGGWYPDRKVRLFDRRRARFDGRRVHERLCVDGSIGFLAGDLLHDSFRDFDHHVRKTHEMARLWADQEHGHRRARFHDLVLRPGAKFCKRYVWRGGFREGWRGLLIAGMAAYADWLKYAWLLTLSASPPHRSGPAPARSRRQGPEPASSAPPPRAPRERQTQGKDGADGC